MPKVIRWFSNRYGVNLEEAEKEVEDYPSLADFFVRDLKPGARPISEGFVSPVDGRITEFGHIEDGKLLQVKGRHYLLKDLLKDEQMLERFSGGSFATIYLAPPDYHQIHTPVSGVLSVAKHIPGKLWPVNDWSVNAIPNLFAVNERINLQIESKDYGTVGLILVGATNVGSIRLKFDDLVSNDSPPLLFDTRSSQRREYQKQVSKGESVAAFHMGSTVVLLLDESSCDKVSLLKPGRVKLGQTLFT